MHMSPAFFLLMGQTDRRSLNRARPPPIYMQREEEITPGVWPPGYVFNSRNGEKGTQKASIPSASSTSPSSSTSSSAAATSASTRPSSNTRNNTNAPPAAATSSASSGASSVSRFNMARRVMSENLDAGGSRGYSINASTNGRGSSSGSDGAPLPSMAANNATIRSQAHNPLTNRLARLNLGSQVRYALAIVIKSTLGNNVCVLRFLPICSPPSPCSHDLASEAQRNYIAL